MKTLRFLFILIFFSTGAGLFAQTYTMPPEGSLHEGTWLQWPHQHEYGLAYRNSLDTTWVNITRALIPGENVHIIAYDSTEQARITTLLGNFGISLTNIDFKKFKTNDVWVRDNGPIFVNDENGNLTIEDWGFNGWGGKFNYAKDNAIPTEVANAIALPVVDLNATMVVEGGAYEVDGNGTLIACKSSMLSQSPPNTVRNPGMTQAEAETIFTANLGVSKFIWLNGLAGGDITDMHIDGFVQFANDSTIVTMDSADLRTWEVPANDITTLYNATNANGKPYHFVFVPLTQNNVATTKGVSVGYQGSYCNYYIANTAVLVPTYSDANDTPALNIIKTLYPGKTVTGIDVRNLYANGGMVHCVTQQQPATLTTGLNTGTGTGNYMVQNFPNPFKATTTISLALSTAANVQIEIYNLQGQLVYGLNKYYGAGKQNITINAPGFESGVYYYTVHVNNRFIACKKMMVF